MASKSGAVLYCRVSTEDQLSNFSLETQQDQCRKYCEDRGYTVLNVFREAASAKNTDRPEFQRMLMTCPQKPHVH